MGGGGGGEDYAGNECGTGDVGGAGRARRCGREEGLKHLLTHEHCECEGAVGGRPLFKIRTKAFFGTVQNFAPPNFRLRESGFRSISRDFQRTVPKLPLSLFCCKI